VGQLQVTTKRVKGGRKAIIPSSTDPVHKLEHIAKETVKKLQDIQGAADRGVKKYGPIVIPSHTKNSVLTGVSFVFEHPNQQSVYVSGGHAIPARILPFLFVPLFILTSVKARMLQSAMQPLPGTLPGTLQFSRVAQAGR